MDLPEPELYTDVDSNTILPPLTDDHIAEFLERFNKKGDVGKRMYHARFLRSCQVAYMGVDVFLKGKCNEYTVHIKIGEDGDVDETSCDCCPEEESFAQCNHVIVLLFAAEEIVREGTVQLHIPKKKLETNFNKAIDRLPFKKDMNETDSEEHNPIPRRYRNSPNYNEFVRKLCLKYGPSSMPIKQLFAPTELESSKWDHCYGKSAGEL